MADRPGLVDLDPILESDSFPVANENAQIQVQPKQPPSLLEGVKLAAQTEQIYPAVLNHFGISRFTPDPNFRLTPELVRELGEGLPVDLWDDFASATSLEQALFIKDKLVEKLDARDQLASLGWRGTALRIGASIFDPTALAISFGVASAAGPVIYSTKLNRMQRFLRGGMVAGGTEATIESLQQLGDPERDGLDIIYAGLGGFILGGGALSILPTRPAPREITPLRGGPRRLSDTGDDVFTKFFLKTGIQIDPFDEAARDLAKEIELRDILNSGLSLTEKGDKYFAKNLDKTTLKQRLRGLLDGLDATPEEIDNYDVEQVFRGMFTKTGTPGSEASIKVDTRLPETELEFDKIPQDPPVSTFGRFRIDMVGQGKRSKVPTVRRLFHMYAEDPFPNRDGTPNVLSASEWVTKWTRIREARFERAVIPSFSNWAKRNGHTLLNSRTKEKEFFETISKAVRRDPNLVTDPDIKRVADLLRDEYAEMLGIAKRAGVEGFSDIPESATYMMRIANKLGIDQAIDKFGIPKVQTFLRNAIISGSEGTLTTKQSDRLANAWLGHHLHATFETDVSKANMFSIDRSDSLRRLLQARDVPKKDIDEIVEIIQKKGKTGIPRARRRIDFDETYGEKIFDDAGNELGELNFEDLLENDARKLFNVYSRDIHGEVAHTRLRQAFAEEGGRPPTFPDLVKRIEREAQELSEAGTKVNPRTLNSEVNKLEALDRALLGIPLTRNDQASNVLRQLRQYNYIRVGGQFGFAQIPEMGQILFNPRVVAQQIPAFKQVWSRAANGNMSNELLDELESLLALGTDWLRDHPVARFDELGSLSGNLSRVDEGLQRASKFISAASFMAPVNSALQRVAGATAVQRWMNIATSGKKLSKKRLASMGLTPEQGDAILSQMRDHVTTEKGLFGRRIKRINLSEWQDQESASRFTNALFKWSRRTVQENDIGNLSLWMTTDIGRTITQFRPFVINAWSKQFLFNLHMRDVEAGVAVATSTVFGGMVYIGQQYANSIGRSDQRAFLEERLTPQKIAAAAFQRSGFGSIFPPIVDTVLPTLGFDPVFQFGRTSQLSTDILFGNPTTDLLNRGQRGIRGLVSPVLFSDVDLTQKGLRNAFQVLPFSNILGARNLLNSFSSQFPEE